MVSEPPRLNRGMTTWVEKGEEPEFQTKASEHHMVSQVNDCIWVHQRPHDSGKQFDSSIAGPHDPACCTHSG